MTKTNAEEIAAEEKDKNARDERKKKWNATQWMCFAIVLIPLVAYVIFNGFPILISFVSMFTDLRKNNLSTMHWNNFENFIGYTDAYGEFHHGVFNESAILEIVGGYGVAWERTDRFAFDCAIDRLFVRAENQGRESISGAVLYPLYLFLHCRIGNVVVDIRV